MPQFDKITFFNQLFWLFIFFSGFYLTLLKIFLPKLSSILKARNKKLQKGSTNLAALSEEQTFVTFIFHNLIETFSSNSIDLLIISSKKLTFIQYLFLLIINKTDLKKSNILMEKLLYKQITTTFLVLNF